MVPIDPNDKETWGDKEHRLAQVSETTVIHKHIVEVKFLGDLFQSFRFLCGIVRFLNLFGDLQVRDNQWWRSFSRGYITQWAEMNPQRSDAFFYAHSISDVQTMAPMLLKFRGTPGRKAYLVISGGQFCSCEEAAEVLGWSLATCKDRRFRLFDLEVNTEIKP